MYISNLIITVSCCFPVIFIVLKVVENSCSMLYQHNIPTLLKVEGLGRVTCRIEQSWESMRRCFTIHFIFLDIKKPSFYIKKSIPFLDIRTFFDLKKSISWYQKIDSWYKEKWIDILYQEIGLIFLYHWFFFHIKKWNFLNQKSIYDITKYRINSETTPQRAVLLFIPFFLNSWYKKTSIWVFDIKYQLDFLNQEFHFLCKN